MKSTKKLDCVLLDAMIVIEAHALGIWENLHYKIDIFIPSTVVRNEAFFFDTKKGKRRGAILIGDAIKQGKITEITATSRELKTLHDTLDYATMQGLHEGELEALAIIKGGKVKSCVFCTADIPAIRALALLGYSHLGISLERLLKQVGLQKPLDRQYKEDFFKLHLNRGSQDRITGIGLRNKEFLN